MIPDTQAIPDVSLRHKDHHGYCMQLRIAQQTLHVLIADACKLSDADFEALKAGYMKDLFEDSVHGVGHLSRTPRITPFADSVQRSSH